MSSLMKLVIYIYIQEEARITSVEHWDTYGL